VKVSLIDSMPELRGSVPNMATETSSDGGYSYDSFTPLNAKLYLDFRSLKEPNSLVFTNPYAGSSRDKMELLPVDKNAVIVLLSDAAKQLKAQAHTEFSGLSPRIVVTFPADPPPGLNVGATTLGFIGVWPLHGKYECVNLPSWVPCVRYSTEPFGPIVSRYSALRCLKICLDEQAKLGNALIEASDPRSIEYTTDMLLEDLFELMFESVTARTVRLKSNTADLPSRLKNTYDSVQENLFIRSVQLLEY